MVNLTKAEILSNKYTAACERDSLQCDSLYKFGFDEDKVTQLTNTTPLKLVELLLKNRVDFVAINQKTMSNDLAIIETIQDDIYVHTELHTRRAYLAAPIKISPDLLNKLKSTPVPTQ